MEECTMKMANMLWRKIRGHEIENESVSGSNRRYQPVKNRGMNDPDRWDLIIDQKVEAMIQFEKASTIYALRKFSSIQSQQAKKGIFTTTSHFSKDTEK